MSWLGFCIHITHDEGGEATLPTMPSTSTGHFYYFKPNKAELWRNL